MSDVNRLIPPHFAELYTSFLTNLLEADPKRLPDIYELSAQYFENKVKERSGETAKKDKRSFSRDVLRSGETKQFLPDFSYDSDFVIHPKLSPQDKLCKQSVETLLHKKKVGTSSSDDLSNPEKQEKKLPGKPQIFQKKEETNQLTNHDINQSEHKISFSEEQEKLKNQRQKGQKTSCDGQKFSRSKELSTQDIILKQEMLVKDDKTEKLMAAKVFQENEDNDQPLNQDTNQCEQKNGFSEEHKKRRNKRQKGQEMSCDERLEKFSRSLNKDAKSPNQQEIILNMEKPLKEFKIEKTMAAKVSQKNEENDQLMNHDIDEDCIKKTVLEDVEMLINNEEKTEMTSHKERQKQRCLYPKKDLKIRAVQKAILELETLLKKETQEKSSDPEVFNKNKETNRLLNQEVNRYELKKAFADDQDILNNEKIKEERDINSSESLNKNSKKPNEGEIILDVETLLKKEAEQKLNAKHKKGNFRNLLHDFAISDEANNTEKDEYQLEKGFCTVHLNKENRNKNIYEGEEQSHQLDKQNVRPFESNKNKVILQDITNPNNPTTLLNADISNENEVLHQMVEFSKLLPECLETMSKIFSDLGKEHNGPNDKKENSFFTLDQGDVQDCILDTLSEETHERDNYKQNIREKTLCTTSSQTDFGGSLESRRINSSVLTKAMFEYVRDVVNAVNRLLYSITIQNNNHLPVEDNIFGMSMSNDSNVAFKELQNILDSWKDVMNKPGNKSNHMSQEYDLELQKKNHSINERDTEKHINPLKYYSIKEPKDRELIGEFYLEQNLYNYPDKNKRVCSQIHQDTSHDSGNYNNECGSGERIERNKDSSESCLEKEHSCESSTENQKCLDDFSDIEVINRKERSLEDKVIPSQLNQNADIKNLANIHCCIYTMDKQQPHDSIKKRHLKSVLEPAEVTSKEITEFILSDPDKTGPDSSQSTPLIQNLSNSIPEKKTTSSIADLSLKPTQQQTSKKYDPKKQCRRKFPAKGRLHDLKAEGIFSILDSERPPTKTKETSLHKLFRVDVGSNTEATDVGDKNNTKLVVHEIHQATSELQMRILSSRRVYKEEMTNRDTKDLDGRWRDIGVPVTGKNWLRSYFTTRMVTRYQKQSETDKIDKEAEDLSTPVLKKREQDYGFRCYLNQRSLFGSLRHWYFSKKLRGYQK